MAGKSLEHEFEESFERSLEEPVEQEVLDSGDQECKHSRIFYIDNSFDGQAWWCDGCSRHERMGYSPGFIIKFPMNALISTPNPKYGGKGFYAFRTNDEGKVEDLDKRIKRK
jgi:hypothetical protein